MHTPHPSPQTLDRLLAGALGAGETREVIAHLARRCKLCWRYVRGFVGVAAGGVSLGDFAAAARLLRSAAATYRQYGERHDEARVQQRLALALGHEDPAAGVAAAERALMLIDPGREPQLELGARHALIWFLNDGGHGWRALELLAPSRPLYRQVAENRPRLTLPWLEARICRGLGDLPAAERGLAAVWHEYREAGFDQELTLVSLDLVEVYLAQGKSRHAERLLRSFHSLLRQWGLHGEGVAAWLLLVEAAGGRGGAPRR